MTANTPVELKNFLGGGAYTISGLIQAVKFSPYQGELRTPDGTLKSKAILGAVCNGRQAGGGQQLAPNALINDGLMDLFVLLDFPKERLVQVNWTCHRVASFLRLSNSIDLQHIRVFLHL